jgi:Major Facilitator Superfamily/Cyclic nucleotide-binding domain
MSVGTVRVFRAVLANRDLRRVELAYAGFSGAEYAVWIAMLVFAYRRGGTDEASFVAVLQLLPAAICAPFLALLADRHRPVGVLFGGYLAQALGMGLTAAAILAGAPVAVIYAGAVVAATAVTITRPAQAVIVPSLARSAEELTATNVVSSWVESGGVLFASAFTGVLLTVADVDLIFALMAGAALVSAVLVVRVDGPQPAAAGEAEDARSEALAGFGALREHSHLRLLMGVLMGEFLIWGALDILFVVLAIDVLALGQGWAGYLNAAFGAGGIVGGVAAVALVGRRHLAPPIALGVLAFGGAFVVIALWPSALIAVILLVLSGAGRVVLDVGLRTLLQRTTPSEVLGRVFGLLEGLEMAGLALGALLIPPLVALGGSKTALIGAGLLLPLLGLLMARPLIGVDRGARVPLVEIALLRSMPLFAPLPAPAIEGLARALAPVDLPAGAVVMHMGEDGDRFYAIAEGEVEVSREGVKVARLARGAGFGEIALLEDVPRTATVTAVTDVRLYALEKGPFVTAMTGHAPAAQAASALVSKRREELERLTAGGG